MRKFTTVLTLVLVVALALTGCGSPAPKAETKPAAPAPKAEASLPVKDLVIIAGASGDAWYLAAARVGEILQQEIPGLKVRVVAGTALNNLRTVDGGKEADIGIAGTPMFLEALQGQGEFKDKPLKNVAGLMSFSTDYLQVVSSAKSGIKALKDMANKRISPGRVGSGQEVMARGLLGFFSITPDSIKAKGGQIHNVGAADANGLMKDGHCEVIFFKGPVPFTSIMELESNFQIQFIPIEQDIADKFLSTYAGYVKGTIPANTYKNQTAPVPTLGHSSLLFVRKDLPADFVQRIAQAIQKNADSINKLVAGVSFGADKAKGMVGIKDAEMHPGALKAFTK